MGALLGGKGPHPAPLSPSGDLGPGWPTSPQAGSLQGRRPVALQGDQGGAELQRPHSYLKALLAPVAPAAIRGPLGGVTPPWFGPGPALSKFDSPLAVRRPWASLVEGSDS